MIRIQIPKGYINHAKKLTEEFDSQKTWDKYKCNNNYLGYLGEKMFHEWMDKMKIPHIWKQFMKQATDEPDFIINGKSFDLKTTFGLKLRLREPKFDYYIFSRVTDEVKEHLLIGYIAKEKLIRLIKEDKLQKVGSDYYCPISEMDPFEVMFREIFKKRDIWTDKIQGGDIFEILCSTL